MHQTSDYYFWDVDGDKKYESYSKGITLPTETEQNAKATSND